MRSNDEIVNIIISEKEKRELSLSELARRVGIAKSALSRYLNKTRDFPLNKAKVFADTLGISIEYLLGLENTDEYNWEEIKNTIKNWGIWDWDGNFESQEFDETSFQLIKDTIDNIKNFKFDNNDIEDFYTANYIGDSSSNPPIHNKESLILFLKKEIKNSDDFINGKFPLTEGEIQSGTLSYFIRKRNRYTLILNSIAPEYNHNN